LTSDLRSLPEDQLEIELKRLLFTQYDPGDLGISNDEVEMLRCRGGG
jgi:hypothetical protein